MSLSTERLYKQFGERIHHFIYSSVKDKSIADDILQEVFIKVHNSIDNLKDEAKVHAWIYQITRNVINDYYRNKKPIPIDFAPQILDEDLHEEDKILEAIKDMVLAMDELPQEDCEALCLTEFDGLSQKEYAEKINISYSGAKSRVQRARLKLRDMLMNCCHYQFDENGRVVDYHPIKCCCCSQSK